MHETHLLETLDAVTALRVARTLAKVAASLACADLDSLHAELERCARMLSDLVAADGISICIVDDRALVARAHWYARRGWLRPALTLDLSRASWLRDRLACDVVIPRRGALPAAAAFEREQLAARETTSLVATPLVRGDGTLLGAVVAERYASDRPLSGECASVLEAFAAPIAAAFERVAQDRARADQIRAAETAAVQSRLLWHRMLDELRVPLTVIQGTGQLLQETTPVNPLVHRLLTHADQVIEILHAGLMLGTLQGGAWLSPRQIDAAALVREAAERARPRALALRIELRAELPDAPVLVLADRDKLGRLVAALIAHALGSVPRDRALTVAAREREHSYEIEVRGPSDAAPGAASLTRLGELQRGDASLDELVTELGIWLALASHLARLHGGETSFEDAPGGSFCLRATLLRTPEAAQLSREPDLSRVLG